MELMLRFGNRQVWYYMVDFNLSKGIVIHNENMSIY
jgi:hypothetical protein